MNTGSRLFRGARGNGRDRNERVPYPRWKVDFGPPNGVVTLDGNWEAALQ